MTRYWVGQPLGTAEYHALLDFCSSFCTGYSLVVNKRALPSHEVFAFLERAKPFLLTERQQTRWPGGGTLEPGAAATVVYFRICPSSVQLLKHASKDLYDWVHPFLPEDLAFYRADGSVMLAVIGHEQAAFLELEEQERVELAAAVPGLVLSTVSPV
jgi:hypothetical protein